MKPFIISPVENETLCAAADDEELERAVKFMPLPILNKSTMEIPINIAMMSANIV